MWLFSGGTYPPAYAFLTVGGATAKLGTGIAVGGLVLEVAGAGVLYNQGDSQPLQRATLSLAFDRLQDLAGVTGLPVGVPDPADPLIDALVGPELCSR
jgi:hypothetical protein